MNNEYYELLGVARTASKEEIKKAYKELARKCHPDKGGDPDRFKKINEAYGVLMDDNLRSQYDRFGKTDAHTANPFPDFFNMFPFQMGGHPIQRRTPNRNMDLELTMEESFHGATIKFRYKRKVFRGNVHSSTCSQCNGNGKVMEQIRSPIGIVQNVSMCSACAGMGVAVSENDFQTVSEIVDIHIPPYSGAGKQIILHGQSDEMPKMETGDLILTIVIKKHPLFQLVGNCDILWEVSVHPLEALTFFSRSTRLPCGEEISLEHRPYDGFFSSIQQQRILKGKGLFGANGERGNLLILFSLKEYYVENRDDVVPLSLSLPAFVSGGTPIRSLPFYKEKQNSHHPEHNKHGHPQQPHVQECRPS